jgi:hypothetical protein
MPLLDQRYVWELACFRYTTGPEWKLVTWCVDEEAMYFQPMTSKAAARTAFKSEPPPLLNQQR